MRVFAGNVNFNTTFKSVSFEKGTLVSDLLVNSLKKFRVVDVDVSMYYLTVTPLEIDSENDGAGGT